MAASERRQPPIAPAAPPSCAWLLAGGDELGGPEVGSFAGGTRRRRVGSRRGESGRVGRPRGPTGRRGAGSHLVRLAGCGAAPRGATGGKRGTRRLACLRGEDDNVVRGEKAVIR